MSRVEGPEQLDGAVRAALAYDRRVLLEEAVSGFEVGCAVLGLSLIHILSPGDMIWKMARIAMHSRLGQSVPMKFHMSMMPMKIPKMCIRHRT